MILTSGRGSTVLDLYIGLYLYIGLELYIGLFTPFKLVNDLPFQPFPKFNHIQLYRFILNTFLNKCL